MRGPRYAPVCTGAFMLIASTAFADDPYAEFRIPEARSFSWAVTTSARWSSDDDRFASDSRHDRSSRGDVLSRTHRHAESERGTSDVFIDALGQLSTARASTRFEAPGFTSTSSNQSDFDMLRFSSSAGTTRFLGASSWGVDVAATGDYDFARNASTRNDAALSTAFTSLEAGENRFHAYTGFLGASLGLGYGRIRDASGVFDAQVLERRLEVLGRLKHALSLGARQRLAELFSVSSGFAEAHERPDRYFSREVERILVADDALVDGRFDAWSLQRVLEPATASIVLTRLAGWRVSAGYGGELHRGHIDRDNWFEGVNRSPGVPDFTSRTESSSRQTLNEDVVFALANAQYGHPFGMSWQANAATTATYGIEAGREARLSSTARLDHVIADRWVASAAASQLIVSRRSSGVRLHPTWQTSVELELAWFVEDSWAITATERLSQARPRVVFSGGTVGSDAFQREHQLQVGLTYRPVGRFEAPALGISERLTRMRL